MTIAKTGEGSHHTDGILSEEQIVEVPWNEAYLEVLKRHICLAYSIQTKGILIGELHNMAPEETPPYRPHFVLPVLGVNSSFDLITQSAL